MREFGGYHVIGEDAELLPIAEPDPEIEDIKQRIGLVMDWICEEESRIAGVLASDCTARRLAHMALHAKTKRARKKNRKRAWTAIINALD